MSGLGSDISGLCWICSVKQEHALGLDKQEQQKSRSGAKTMNLGLDKLTTCKLNTIELREIKETTRSNLITRNHT
jgi:hypothetical protein